jgi:hypothetical protein
MVCLGREFGAHEKAFIVELNPHPQRPSLERHRLPEARKEAGGWLLTCES